MECGKAEEKERILFRNNTQTGTNHLKLFLSIGLCGMVSDQREAIIMLERNYLTARNNEFILCNTKYRQQNFLIGSIWILWNYDHTKI